VNASSADMTKVEFIRKWCKGAVGWKDIVDERLRDITAVVDEERKQAKIEAFQVALRLYEKNPAAFPEVIRSLIRAKPPEVQNS
jgi:hypothetical protein